MCKPKIMLCKLKPVMCKLFSSICKPRNLGDSEEFSQSSPCPQLILTGLLRAPHSWFNLWMSLFRVKIKFTWFAPVYIPLLPDASQAIAESRALTIGQVETRMHVEILHQMKQSRPRPNASYPLMHRIKPTVLLQMKCQNESMLLRIEV